MSKGIDCNFTKGAVCPTCGHWDHDAWEIGDGAEGTFDTDCPSCDAPMRVTRHVFVLYSTQVPAPDGSVGDE